MKKIVMLLSLLMASTAFANCRIYIQNTNALKESERLLVSDLLARELESQGYLVSFALNNVNAVLKFGLNPVLVNGEFLQEVNVELQQADGQIFKAKAQALPIGVAIKKALGQLAGCSDNNF